VSDHKPSLMIQQDVHENLNQRERGA
jgi:hypothetical protein